MPTDQIKLPLDPYPFICYQPGADVSYMRHAVEHEGYVYFDPRDGFEKNEDNYPDDIWG